MRNILRRNDERNLPAAPETWEPARWMRDLMAWDPFREMAPIFRGDERAFSPAFEVKETKDGYEFRADLPGVAEKDLEVTLTGNRLTISGKREAEKEEKGDTYYVVERAYGGFTRAFTLPDGIDADHVRCELKNGVLTAFVPKLPETQPKKIAVKAGDTPKA